MGVSYKFGAAKGVSILKMIGIKSSSAALSISQLPDQLTLVYVGRFCFPIFEKRIEFSEFGLRNSSVSPGLLGGALACSASAHKASFVGAEGVCLVGAGACCPSAHNSVPCWHARVLLVGAEVRSLSAHKGFTCRRTRVYVVGAQLCLLSAHKGVSCWRTSTPTVGAHKCSSLAHKSAACRRLPSAQNSNRCRRAQVCSRRAHASVPSWRPSFFTAGAQECCSWAHKCVQHCSLFLHQGFLLDPRSWLAQQRVHRRRVGAEGLYLRRTRVSSVALSAHNRVRSARARVHCWCTKRVRRWRRRVFFMPMSAHKSVPRRRLPVGAKGCSLSAHSSLAHKHVHRRQAIVFSTARESVPCRRMSVPTIGAQKCSLLARPLSVHKCVHCGRTQV